ncbi:Hsp70 family protein [Actinomyces sp. 186855]|nr:Hsp70 family protein [Actinomyces sp. AC-20-1]MCL3788905.1 Hsp70 family protein [Actinomyces sp. 187325]MCL3792195.1 Hsp70 family protein [Actinomyces sp. 186855]MCL3794178.1 Hsp70 family protein [Actinomyces sp. 217892]
MFNTAGTRRRRHGPDAADSTVGTTAADGTVRLGIDLGTTRTVVSLVDRGNYPVLGFTDTRGDRHEYLPSLTALTDGGLVHGFAAQEAVRSGAPVLRSLKRVLGSPTVSWSTPVRVGTQEHPVGEVLTGFLNHLRTELEATAELSGADLSATPHQVAVAVPAHAYGAQRMLTLDAFAAAGFHVVQMLHEPSAAGFEYTHRQGSTVNSRRTRVLVYDLGGGTFDTSLVDVSGSDHEVRASRGLPDLGGDDIDLILAQLVLSRAGVAEQDLTPSERDDLLDQCQQAKESLSPQTRRLVVDLRDEPVVLPVAELYEATRGLVVQSIEVLAPLAGRLEDGGPDLTQVAGIYLVGGASSYPQVPRLLRESFGRRVHRSAQPGASTAIGLAIAVDPGSGMTLTDRLSRALGVFREAEDGGAVTFDLVLSPDAVLSHNGLSQAGTGVVEREYRAVHNVARLRYVECAGADEDGGPLGRVSPCGELLFPVDRGLREVEDLSEVPVVRTGDGPVLRERYEVGADGVVRVTLTDLTDGYSRSRLIGRTDS